MLMEHANKSEILSSITLSIAFLKLISGMKIAI